MNKKRIYADHAATTPLLPEALEAMLPFLKGEFGNPSSLHSWSKKPRAAVAEARATIAECVGADSDEIFFTSGGTEGNNWALKCTGAGLMVSSYEHHAVLNAAESERNRGRDVVFVSPGRDGCVHPRSLSRNWKDGIGLVSVMVANNEIGTINSIQRLAELVHKKGALFHADAVQAVGHEPVNVRELGVDFMSASAHKFNGPKGVGFLFVKKGTPLGVLLDGGQQEFGLRAGTENVASIVGMATALKWNCTNVENHRQHLEKLCRRLRDGVMSICPDAIFPGVDSDDRLPGILSVSFPNVSAEGIVHILDLNGIAVSSGAACDSKNTQISHVLNAIHLPKRFAKGTIRVSFGWENTIEDVDAIVSALKLAVRRGK